MSSSRLLKYALGAVVIVLATGAVLYVLGTDTTTPDGVAPVATTTQSGTDTESLATTKEETRSTNTSEPLSVVNDGCVDGWCRYTIDEKYEIEAPEEFQLTRHSKGGLIYENEPENISDRLEPHGEISVSFWPDPIPFEEWAEPTILVEPVTINGDTWYAGNATIVPCANYIYYRGSFFVDRVMFKTCLSHENFDEELEATKVLHEHTDLVERVLGSIREIKPAKE
ncbi:hypothetical protein GVX82_03730 [Patescibacteria group bacterium]|jgi:hypothetical protein|nr:hypothetical protein [Patescibacteria group bacterium]